MEETEILRIKEILKGLSELGELVEERDKLVLKIDNQFLI